MTEIKKLLVLQEIDCKIRDIRKEIEDIPKRQALEEERLESYKKAVDELSGRLSAGQAKLKEFELETQSLRDKIAKLRQQQMQLKTNKEFKAMEDEIAAVEEEIAKIEDAELVVMEENEQIRKELAEKKTVLAREEDVVARDIAAWKEREAELKGILEKEEAARREAAEPVDPEWLATYERIFQRRNLALVPIEHGEEGYVCGGCHMKQPPFVLQETHRTDRMTTCGMCGCLLYDESFLG